MVEFEDIDSFRPNLFAYMKNNVPYDTKPKCD